MNTFQNVYTFSNPVNKVSINKTEKSNQISYIIKDNDTIIHDDNEIKIW